MPDPSRYLADYSDSLLYIGKVAEITGASRKAIRHYEAIGLLPPPQRRGAYRIYNGRDVFIVHVIKHTQSYGFTLAELRELIAAISKQDNFPIQVALDAVERKRVAVRPRTKSSRRTSASIGRSARVRTPHSSCPRAPA